MKKVKVRFLDKDLIFSSISHRAHILSDVETDNGLDSHIPAVIFGMSVKWRACVLFAVLHSSFTR